MKKTAQVSVRRNSKKGGLDLEVEVPVFLMKEGKIHVAYSPMLQLCSHGKTKQQAEKHFRGTMELFFEGLMEMGTLDTVLQDLGWTKQNRSWESPVEVKQIIAVPFRPVATAR